MADEQPPIEVQEPEVTGDELREFFGKYTCLHMSELWRRIHEGDYETHEEKNFIINELLQYDVVVRGKLKNKMFQKWSNKLCCKCKEEDSAIKIQLPYVEAKRQCEAFRGLLFQVMLELVSFGSDIAFLFVVLPGVEPDLHLISLYLLFIAIVSRFLAAFGISSRVNFSYLPRYNCAVLVNAIETNAGLALMKMSLKPDDDEVIESYDNYWSRSIEYTRERDPVAVAAENGYRAGWAELRNILVVTLIEDLPQLTIQVIFLIRQREEVNAVFVIAICTTVAHIVFQWVEAGITICYLAKTACCCRTCAVSVPNSLKLRDIMRGRDLIIKEEGYVPSSSVVKEDFRVKLMMLNLRSSCIPCLLPLVVLAACYAPFYTYEGGREKFAHRMEKIARDYDDATLTVCCWRKCLLRAWASRCKPKDPGVYTPEEYMEEYNKHIRRVTQFTYSQLNPEMITLVIENARLEWLDSIDMFGYVFDQSHYNHVRFRFLVRLILDETNVTDQGLSLMLRNCSSIMELGLGRTSISDAAVEEITQRHKKLRTINLQETNVNTNVLGHLVQELKFLEVVNLGGTRINAESIEELCGKNKLRWLGLSHCQGVTEDVCWAISECRKLQCLDLSGCPLTDDTLVRIVENCQLRKLWIDESAVSSDGIEKAVRHTHALQVLSVADLDVTDEHVEQLFRENQSLRALNLRGTAVSDECLLHVSRSVKKLDISHMNTLSTEGVTAFLSAIREWSSDMLETFDVKVRMDDCEGVVLDVVKTEFPEWWKQHLQIDKANDWI